MTTTFELKVLSPNRALPSFKARSAVLPGTLGYMTILPDHAAMIAELEAGEVVVEAQGAPAEHFFISGGYVEVDHNRVSVLADVVEKAKDINLAQAEAALSAAQAVLSSLTPDVDVEEANRVLRSAQARVQVARGSSQVKH
ncbi:MAG: ATP synthase F1 subunit epsilon [Proteobacteria bacterium]|jgi:F-type H+-transporting ATPase subunit epsilon|nr:MAG: ATP synthase F1 subunit epsilon [Pseudomonadota bacterium]